MLRHPDAVLVSALSGEGIETLCEQVERAFEDTLAEVELLVPYSEGARLHELHELAGDLERTERADGVLVHARVPRTELHRFEDLSRLRRDGDGVSLRLLGFSPGGWRPSEIAGGAKNRTPRTAGHPIPVLRGP